MVDLLIIMLDILCMHAYVHIYICVCRYVRMYARVYVACMSVYLRAKEAARKPNSPSIYDS